MSRKGNKGEFVSALGVIFEIIKKISDALKTLGGSDDDLRRVLTDSTLAKKLAEVIMAGKQKVRETYKVVVDYGLSLSEMIKLGNYGWFNDDITDKHFPMQGTGKHEVELVLVHLNQNATTKEVLEYLNREGLEPAKIEHLLAFGAAYPEIQREFLVIAFGSVWVDVNGHRFYPSLDCLGGKRELLLDWCDDARHWGATCRFLAVGK
jgi:hypothetical protein